MGISDISGKLASLVATTPRLTALESVLQASLSLTHAPVSSRAARVDKLGETAVSRQAVDSPNQPVLKPPHDSPRQGLHAQEPVLTHLSRTAGFLSSLLPPQEKGHPARAVIPAAVQPVLEEPPSYPAPLAIALQSNLQESGLFYESHLLNWYQGQYPRELLLREPQSQLARLTVPNDARTTAGQSSQGTTSASLQENHGQAVPALPSPGQTGPAENSASAMKALIAMTYQSSEAANPFPDRLELSDKSLVAAREQAAPALHSSEAAKLISQQLLLLDKPSLEWSVNVWPGQTATMLIEEETTPVPEIPSSWSTTIQLDFPTLGHMEIRLRMDADGLRVRLNAENEATLPLLMGQRVHCAEKLATTGCRVREFSMGNGRADA